MNVSLELIAIVALLVTALGFLWSIHRDVSSLCERMVRVESMLENLVGRPPEPQA